MSTQAQRGDGYIVPTHRNFCARGVFVVTKTTRLLYPRERTGANFTEGQVGHRVCLDGHENLAATGIRSPDGPDRSESLY